MDISSDTTPKGAGTAKDAALPLVDTGAPREAPVDAAARTARAPRRWRRLPLLLLIPLLLFTGGVIGLYFQPPGLRAFFGATGLEPGAGSSSPIAVRPAGSEAEAAPAPAPSARDVVALGRVQPDGDTRTIAPPFGAGDARIDALAVEEGDVVAVGDLLATLDSLPQLTAARDAAASAVMVRQAALTQTRAAIAASLAEAEAMRDRASAALTLARQELARARDLRDRGVGTQARLDQAQSAASEAERELARTEAVLSRYAGYGADDQPDVALALSNLDAAEADLARAESDLAKGRVLAPQAGTVLKIHARPGEKPGANGILTLADTAHMVVKLEVYQADIARVRPDQVVTMESEALGDQPLGGIVRRIGLEVGRQSILGADPAANTDARVIEVTVSLDQASAARAARFTGLEVIGRIRVEQGG